MVILKYMSSLISLPNDVNKQEVLRLMELREIPSRNALARKAGLNTQHLYRILKGEIDPTLGTVEKIARALGVRKSDIIKD